ncbi:Exonuclease V [Colletotrichum chlorophyti]|uniref:Exonuclease V n=1 Tax=Colletotrichum chlorophyti TaxID=708187 RepID=A0A1Q8S7C2_9PEZI|nr:Exonuclease V [Colletotrichum chlorophyti]
MAASLSLDSDGDDYGYDLSLEDETLLSQLITAIPAATLVPLPSRTPAAASVASELGVDTVTEEEFRLDHVIADTLACPSSATAKAPLLPSSRRSRAFVAGNKTLGVATPSTNSDGIYKYPDLSRTLSSGNAVPSSSKSPEQTIPEPMSDTRSPLVRFRSFPRKPFTVTDLTAGAWCELQYFYTLTRLPFGRKTRTAAMKQGTKVHQDLEDEVHTTVRVEIATKVDAFGLRVWNVIQGLRTLRETGMTRELEVWGFVDGNLVNGVIDGLSYENPDPEFVERLGRGDDHQNQSSITDYFPSNKPADFPLIYLTDVKTRGSMNAPNSPALLRPAKVQLFLYQRFLSEMAADKLDYLRIFRRYNLDPDEPFSDSFIAQIGSLHDELFSDVESSLDGDYAPPSSGTLIHSAGVDEGSNPAQSSSPGLVKYGTLRELLPLLRSELKETFPHGADSIGRLLAVEYRYRGDGSLIDSQVFPMDDGALDLYLNRTMEWWRADREPYGVQIEEAYKCRMCEFVGDCTWRSAMDEERLRSTRQRLASRKKHDTSG